VAIPMWVAPDLIVGVFLKGDEAVRIVDAARLPMRLVGVTMTVEALGMVLMHSLLGAGDTRRVMVVAVLMQWAVFLPLAWLLGPVLGGGLTAVWIAQIGYRAVQTGIFWRFWTSKRWAGITV
jgi:MATE family multidrug resistance protein